MLLGHLFEAKRKPRRKIYTIQPEGSAKQDISSGLFMRLWLASARCPQPRRAVLPDESWPSYESSTATAGNPTDDRRRGRLRMRAPWPELSLICRKVYVLLKPYCLGSFTIHESIRISWCTWEPYTWYTLGQNMEYMPGVLGVKCQNARYQ